jgi:hypothetical protein
MTAKWATAIVIAFALGAAGALMIQPAASQKSPLTVDEAKCILEHIGGVASEQGAGLVRASCQALNG